MAIWTLSHTRSRLDRVEALRKADAACYQPNPLGDGYLTRNERYNELRWALEAREEACLDDLLEQRYWADRAEEEAEFFADPDRERFNCNQ